MTQQEFRDAVRYETGNDGDTQYDDTMLDRWLYLSYSKLYRRLAAAFPDLFTTTSGNQTITAGNQTIAKSGLTRFAHVVRVEKQIEGQWLTVPQASKAYPEQDIYLGWREEGANIVLSPLGSAPGTYRVVYVQGPHATAFQPAEVVEGFEDVVIQWAAAKADKRLEESSGHQTDGDNVLKEQIKALKSNRRGNAPEPGMLYGYGSAAVLSEID